MDPPQLPEHFRKVQRSLQPYIKSRQDTSHIRRVLALHLSSQTNQTDNTAIIRPLSLVDPERNVEASPHGFRGLQKEYLRCVKANLKAKNEFDQLSKQHRNQEKSPGATTEPPKIHDESSHHIESFVELVKQRQKHERLHIIQDYIDLLAQKPAAAPDHLNANLILQDVEALPKIPPEILGNSSIARGSDGRSIEALVDELEKSVFRAKMLLKREQKLLAKVQSENGPPSPRQGQLQALGETRNELISWIETELATASESPENQNASPSQHGSESQGKDYVDAQLSSIKQQYAQYTKSRECLISSTTAHLDISIPKPDDDTTSPPPQESYKSNGMQVTYPYLKDIVNVSVSQKAMIQQKSHITITLAKQLKEARQGLDRLADESYLLHLYPIPVTTPKRKGLGEPISFGDEISSYEKPDSSHRARAWVFAADSAGRATKDVILEKLEEGNKNITDAQQKLLALRLLLGENPEDGKMDREPAAGGETKFYSGDIWAILDGNLGVIKGDETYAM